jgi:hypothetical protein
MARRKAFKLCSGCAALVFTATSGVTGMQMHPLSAHPESEAILAMEMGLGSQPMASMPATHAMHHMMHHGQHSMPGSSNDCTCPGPCAGGGPPTLASHLPGLEIVPQSGPVQVVYAPEPLIRSDPMAYLRPLPNAPPTV